MGETKHIIAGNFIDGSGSDVQRNIFLAVRDGVITGIGSAETLSREDNIPVENLSHCTLVPALIDCSVFLARSPSVGINSYPSDNSRISADKNSMLKRHINYCFAHGVLGIVENDNSTDIRKGTQTKPLQNKVIDIRISGDEILKVNYSGSIEEKKLHSTFLSDKTLSGILHNGDGKKTIVIANGPEDVRTALKTGCDAIEQGYGMGKENLKEMAQRNVLWIPSILKAKNSLDNASSGGSVCCRFSTRYVAPGEKIPGAESYWKKILAEQIDQLRVARELGVKTAIGTGAGSVGILHGESVTEEIKLFIKAGYSLVEAIQCASMNAAEFLGMKELGALAVGNMGTFLVTRGTAQQLPRKLGYLEKIYISGSPSIAYSKNPN